MTEHGAAETSARTSGVGHYLDDAKVGGRHFRLLGLIGGGSFFDAFDLYLAGSVVAAMVQSHFASLTTSASFLSSTALGLLVGTLAGGWVGDRYGRRTSYLYALLIYGLASVLTAWAASSTQVIGLRLVTGLGLGAVLITGYGMWNEFTPRDRRARWAALLSMLVNLSQPAAALAGFLVIPSLGWRAMFLIAGVPALVIWLLQLRYLPESPRWLESRGRIREALAIARTFNPDAPDAPEPAAPVAGSGAPTESAGTPGATPAPSAGIATLFRGPLRRVTVVAIFISVCNLVPYYAFQSWVPTYLLHQGVSLRNSLGLSVFMQLGAVPGALLGGWLGDRFGRKWTNVGLFALLGVIGLVYAHSDSSTELMVTGFIWVMVANIAIAMQIALYIPELFPTEVRMQGSAVANSFGRLGTAVAPYLVSATVTSLGVTAVFVGSFAIFLVGALAVALLGPETRARSLEDIASSYH